MGPNIVRDSANPFDRANQFSIFETVDSGTTAVGTNESEKDMQGGLLSGTVRDEKARNLTWFRRERQRIENRLAPYRLVNPSSSIMT